MNAEQEEKFYEYVKKCEMSIAERRELTKKIDIMKKNIRRVVRKFGKKVQHTKKEPIGGSGYHLRCRDRLIKDDSFKVKRLDTANIPREIRDRYTKIDDLRRLTFQIVKPEIHDSDTDHMFNFTSNDDDEDDV